ncbi:MAG TPA: ATP-binding protein [Acidimicrobiales bacterium]|nr:ATP-binding protein [Acidimicrobiales bacterium]
MRLTLSICLPRDSVSIPVSRHIIRDTLKQIGVTEECLADIAVAQSEACTNVVEHSGPGEEYEISVQIVDDYCIITVTDSGQGFDTSQPSAEPVVLGEGGRGIDLMKALVDNVHFVTQPGSGTSVFLKKGLHFRDDPVVRRLARG